MKKLKLNLEDLRVESFQTTPDDPWLARGTVRGYGDTPECTTNPVTCEVTCNTACAQPGCPTYQCGGTEWTNCDPSCGPTQCYTDCGEYTCGGEYTCPGICTTEGETTCCP